MNQTCLLQLLLLLLLLPALSLASLTWDDLFPANLRESKLQLKGGGSHTPEGLSKKDAVSNLKRRVETFLSIHVDDPERAVEQAKAAAEEIVVKVLAYAAPEQADEVLALFDSKAAFVRVVSGVCKAKGKDATVEDCFTAAAGPGGSGGSGMLGSFGAMGFGGMSGKPLFLCNVAARPVAKAAFGTLASAVAAHREALKKEGGESTTGKASSAKGTEATGSPRRASSSTDASATSGTALERDLCPWGPDPDTLIKELTAGGRCAKRPLCAHLHGLFEDMVSPASGWTPLYAACVVGQLLDLELGEVGSGGASGGDLPRGGVFMGAPAALLSLGGGKGTLVDGASRQPFGRLRSSSGGRPVWSLSDRLEAFFRQEEAALRVDGESYGWQGAPSDADRVLSVISSWFSKIAGDSWAQDEGTGSHYFVYERLQPGSAARDRVFWGSGGKTKARCKGALAQWVRREGGRTSRGGASTGSALQQREYRERDPRWKPEHRVDRALTAFHAFTLGYLARVEMLDITGTGRASSNNAMLDADGRPWKPPAQHGHGSGGSNPYRKRVRLFRTDSSTRVASWYADRSACKMASWSSTSIFAPPNVANRDVTVAEHRVPIHQILGTYMAEMADTKRNECALKQDDESEFLAAHLGQGTLQQPQRHHQPPPQRQREPSPPSSPREDGGGDMGGDMIHGKASPLLRSASSSSSSASSSSLPTATKKEARR